MMLGLTCKQRSIIEATDDMVTCVATGPMSSAGQRHDVARSERTATRPDRLRHLHGLRSRRHRLQAQYRQVTKAVTTNSL